MRKKNQQVADLNHTEKEVLKQILTDEGRFIYQFYLTPQEKGVVKHHLNDIVDRVKHYLKWANYKSYKKKTVSVVLNNRTQMKQILRDGTQRDTIVRIVGFYMDENQGASDIFKASFSKQAIEKALAKILTEKEFFHFGFYMSDSEKEYVGAIVDVYLKEHRHYRKRAAHVIRATVKGLVNQQKQQQ